jgi:pyrroline-5-carboxylate reductase
VDQGLVATAITLAPELEAVVRGSRFVAICVRGDQLPAVCETARSLLRRDQVVLTFAAGVSYRAIEEFLKKGNEPTCPLIRAVANICMTAGTGYTWVYFSPQWQRDERVKGAISVLERVGDVRFAETEEILDRNSLLSGTLPALIALFLEAVENAALSLSIDKPLVRDMIAKTAYGALKTIEELRASPQQIVNLVGPPGGGVARASKDLENKKYLKKATSEWFASMEGPSTS